MHAASVPPELIAFVHDYFATYEQLQVLELLRHERSSPWTENQISDRLRLQSTLTRAALDCLCVSRLVAVRAENGMETFAYAPASVDLEHLVNQLLTTYKLQPIEIIRLMSANAIERVRTAALRAFADAFVLRKDKGNG